MVGITLWSMTVEWTSRINEDKRMIFVSQGKYCTYLRNYFYPIKLKWTSLMVFTGIRIRRLLSWKYTCLNVRHESDLLRLFVIDPLMWEHRVLASRRVTWLVKPVWNYLRYQTYLRLICFMKCRFQNRKVHV
jgi:hypothetical protein